MAQENQHSADRDCLIAATLAAGGTAQVAPHLMVERFRDILKAIVKVGGAYQMWSDAQDPEGTGPRIAVL
jgi:hypothetical protein